MSSLEKMSRVDASEYPIWLVILIWLAIIDGKQPRYSENLFEGLSFEGLFIEELANVFRTLAHRMQSPQMVAVQRHQSQTSAMTQFLNTPIYTKCPTRMAHARVSSCE